MTDGQFMGWWIAGWLLAFALGWCLSVHLWDKWRAHRQFVLAVRAERARMRFDAQHPPFPPIEDVLADQPSDYTGQPASPLLAAARLQEQADADLESIRRSWAAS